MGIQNNTASKAYLSKLLQLNLLPQEMYKISQNVSQIHPSISPELKSDSMPELTFGIERILSMKCSSQIAREEIIKKKIFEKSRNVRNVQDVKNTKQRKPAQPVVQVVKPGRRRDRTPLTPLQKSTLEAVYEKTRYITCEKRLDLANELNLEVKQVKNWFQNRRIRDPKNYAKTRRSNIGYSTHDSSSSE